ncbi:5' nucleotidase NucF [soil metagenome]
MQAELLREIKGLLLDLDGTLYTNAGPIVGAPQAIRHIDEAGISYRYVTNATHIPRRDIAARLRELGFPAEKNRIITPAIAIAERLGEDAVCHVLVNDSLLEDLEGVTVTGDFPDYVAVGNLGEGFTYARLNTAFRHLMDGAELISLLENRYWQDADGNLNLDAGPFVAALEYASGKEAYCVGKPEVALFANAVGDLGLSSGEVAMVGDNLYVDVAGAQAAGLTGILVESGSAKPESSSVRPDLILKSVAELPEALGLGM